jgi:hypothetical protein
MNARGVDTKPNAAESARLDIVRAVERLRQARIMETEAVGELIMATVELINGASATTAAKGDIRSLTPPLSATPCYLSVRQLAARIPYAQKTLRNLMLAGELVEGRHFFKRRGRIVFSWPAMCDWIEKREGAGAPEIPLVRNRKHGRSV